MRHKTGGAKVTQRETAATWTTDEDQWSLSYSLQGCEASSFVWHVIARTSHFQDKEIDNKPTAEWEGHPLNSMDCRTPTGHYDVPKWAGKPETGLHLDVNKEGKLIQVNWSTLDV